MPYKDPKKRKEQWNRWAKNHRNDLERRQKQLIRAQARYNIPKSAPCSIKECTDVGERHHPDYMKPLEVVWLCNKHHDLLHKPPIRLCKIEGCNKIHRALGLCHTHWTRVSKYSKRNNMTFDSALSTLLTHLTSKLSVAEENVRVL